MTTIVAKTGENANHLASSETLESFMGSHPALYINGAPFKSASAAGSGAVLVTVTSTAMAVPQPTVVDTSFGTSTASQWHLNNPSGIDMNVAGAWQDYTGKGVKVAVADDGMQTTHAEFYGRYNANIDYNVLTKVLNGSFTNAGDRHGTSVAGVIGAANNGTGTTGIAYESTLTSFKILGGGISSAMLIDANAKQGAWVDVSNNSWGWTSPFGGNALYAAGVESALQTTMGTSRGGLGTVFVFAAGNSRANGDNVNYSEMNNSRFVMNVAAGDSNGVVTSFSTPGAALLVTAAGLNVYTTDLTGAYGFSATNYATVSGTSFAAPAVSGVVALMLQANKGLGYRDVQEILAASSRQTDTSNSSWETNGAKSWNGGGMHASEDYGFGFVDATAATRLSETWNLAKTANKLGDEVSVAATSGTVNLSVNDFGTTTSTLSVASGVNIEHVEVQLNMTHAKTGDLVIKLISPDGTESLLFNRPSNGANTTAYDSTWSLSSTQHWGETGQGTWTLQVQDLAGGNTGLLSSWNLKLYGEALSNDTNYVYTNELSNYASDSARTNIIDSTGTDTLNASAVTSASTINLAAGSNCLVDGVSLHIGASTTLENAYTGDGNDSLTGNSVANILFAGRGDDTVYGLSGDDTLYGFHGNDTLDGGVGNDTMAGGKGDDLYYVDSATDLIVEAVNEGTDTVLAAFSYTLGLNVENLTLTGTGNLDATGNTLNNTLTGTSGNNVLNGGYGNDTLFGNGGVDTFLGGAGNDVYYLNSASDSLTDISGIDTVFAGFSLSLTSTTALGAIENITLTGAGNYTATGTIYNNILTGNSGTNLLDAGAGNDKLYGDAGNDTLLGGLGYDTLDGGLGVDVMVGGAGNDTYYLDTLGDTATELYAEGVDVAYVAFSYSLDNTNIENLTLTGTGDFNATGSVVNNILTGNDGNNILSGGLGADSMIGKGGDDTYIVDNGYDRAVEAANGGVDTVQSSVSYAIAGYVENLTLTGTADLKGTGTSLANTLVGNSGNNQLVGGLGNDTYEGGAGNDLYIDTSGNDTYRNFGTGFGSDTLRDTSGLLDVLDLSNWTLGQVSFSAVDTADTGGYVDALRLNFSDGSSLFIEKYFSNSSLDDDFSGKGIGHIESMLFSGGQNVNLAGVQSLIA